MDSTRVSLLVRLRDAPSEVDWEAFYRAYAGVILAYGAKRGLSAHESEEVLQETMVDLMRILPGFTYSADKGLFRNFLLTIVHRKCIRAQQRKFTRKELSMQEPTGEDGRTIEDSLAAPAADTGADEERAWQEAILAQAWELLKRDETIQPQTLQVFEAYALRNESASEVARKFGLKENAVYQIRNRLMKRLREEVQALAPEVQ